MGQIGNIVEQIAMLHLRGHNIILVSSGSITIGKMVLHRQYLLSGSMQSHLCGQVDGNVHFYEKACAAAGQSGLQSLYEVLFAQYHLNCSQVLASDTDFREPQVRENLKRTLRTLLDVGIIPVINENDIITRRTEPLLSGDKMAWDNDSLASLFALRPRGGGGSHGLDHGRGWSLHGLIAIGGRSQAHHTIPAWRQTVRRAGV